MIQNRGSYSRSKKIMFEPARQSLIITYVCTVGMQNSSKKGEGKRKTVEKKKRSEVQYQKIKK